MVLYKKFGEPCYCRAKLADGAIVEYALGPKSAQLLCLLGLYVFRQHVARGDHHSEIWNGVIRPFYRDLGQNLRKYINRITIRCAMLCSAR